MTKLLKIFFIILVIPIIAILTAVFFVIYNNKTTTQLIKYADTKNHYSFLMPSSVKPIATNLTIFEDFQQFTVPFYLSEGGELIPMIQALVINIKNSSDPTKKTPSTLDEFVSTRLADFGNNPVKTSFIIDEHSAQKVCRTDSHRYCAIFVMLKDNQDVLALSLTYPLQGLRSNRPDIVMESAYNTMITSLTFLINPKSSINSANTLNTNKNIPVTSGDPWWYGIGTFQQGKYYNSECNLALNIPAGWYLQQQQYYPADTESTDSTDLPRCFAQFGDDNKDWKVQIVSQANPTNLSLEDWEKQQMQFDTPFAPKNFGEVKTLFLQRSPRDLIEESYMQIAIAATKDWVHTLQYLDHRSQQPNHSAFTSLIATLRVYADTLTP